MNNRKTENQKGIKVEAKFAIVMSWIILAGILPENWDGISILIL